MHSTLVDIYIVLSIGALVLQGLFLISLYRALRRSRDEKERIETACRKLEERIAKETLPVVEARLNPHLFKNVLNSIQSHAYQTYYAMDKMSNVLDYILYESGHGLVALQKEIEFAYNFIEINKIKISPLFALTVKSRLEESDVFYTQPLMVPLISVDLIENAFKHADLQSKDAFISILFELKEGVFVLTVSNKISPKSPLHKKNSGIGTMSLEQRLQVFYAGRYSIKRAVEHDVYTVCLSIDLNGKASKVPAT